jgi:LacI family transcriptional regulator
VPRPTIADVAREAATSKATVSRVLNGEIRYVRPEVRERVASAIARLGYRPSALARSLVSRRTHTIGLLVSDIANPFYPEVVRGVESAALANGLSVFLGNTAYDLERGLGLVRSFADRQVDGVILMSSQLSEGLVDELVARQVPTVVVDWPVSGAPDLVRQIEIDYATGIAAAAQHLVALGHRRFAHVGGPPDLPTSSRRRDAFASALAALGFPPEALAVVTGDLRIAGGRQALEAILALPEHPTAVFAANDLSAIGLVWAARDRGLRVPEDLSVVGLDDIQLAAEIDPPLTTVALPRCALGELAVRLLFASPDDAIRPTTIATSLVIRRSTAPAGTSHASRKRGEDWLPSHHTGDTNRCD